jgi:hypothetical protein
MIQKIKWKWYNFCLNQIYKSDPQLLGLLVLILNNVNHRQIKVIRKILDEKEKEELIEYLKEFKEKDKENE